MSYLGWPRLHFAGRFQADTSTVNNDVRYYKTDVFEPQFQAPMVGHGGGEQQRTNGYWNPDGTGAWRMLGCRITAVAFPGRVVTDETEDSAIGLHLAGSNSRVAGKLVDLDPQQQAVSQIWGLQVALDDAAGQRVLDSQYEVSTFIDLWKRQQIPENFDQTMAAAFQSQLGGLVWSQFVGSPALAQLQAASKSGVLSIRFDVFGYDRSPEADDYTTGAVVGTIGPATTTEPRHFVLGRQLVAKLEQGNPTVPANGVYGFQALNHPDAHMLSADVGHSLPIRNAAGDLVDIGSLHLAVGKRTDIEQGHSVPATDLAFLGEIPYRSANWYRQTAGVVDFSYAHDAWLCGHITQYPVMLVRKEDDRYRVLVCESIDGWYARADNYVFRLNPSETATVDFYATRYGLPTATSLVLAVDNSMIGGAGTGATLNAEKWPVPEVGTPTEALCFESSLPIDATGRAQLTIGADAAGPGHPRGYLDGQVYGLGYRLAQAPPGYIYDPWNFVSVLLWDLWPIPEEPTWFRDIKPIFQQYGNLYPIMSRHLVDLGNYDSVVQCIRPLILSFSLPVTDPNSMPVSRDLSANKRAGILKWLQTPGVDGLPLKGSADAEPQPCAPRVVAAPRPRATASPPQPGGKLDYLMQALAAHFATPENDHAQD